MPRQPLAMPGYLPSIGFDGTLLVDTLLRIWPRPEDRLPSGRRFETITAQTVKLAAVECLPRRLYTSR